jgi:hypothetical protein
MSEAGRGGLSAIPRRRLRRLGANVLLGAGLGLVGMVQSEMLFWTVPPGPIELLDLLFTWIAYGLCAYAAWLCWWPARGGGWPALLLAGCIYGWLVEGVVVDTVSAGLPFTIVWTGMAWHGLLVVLVGTAVFWQARVRPPLEQALMLFVLGLFYAVWAQYWPLERRADPTMALPYLGGAGLAAVGGLLLLERVVPVVVPGRWEWLVLGLIAGLVWLAGTMLAQSPTRLITPLLIGGTILLLRRLPWVPSRGLVADVRLQPWRHGLVLIVFGVAALGAMIGWPLWGGLPVNWPIAAVTSAISTGLYAIAAWRAIRS